MKTLLALLVIIAGTAFTSSHLTTKYNSEKTISLDTLKARVEAQSGGGDEGVEQYLYLTTGVHQDYMGHPYEVDTEQVRNGLVLYRNGEFYDFIEFNDSFSIY